MSVFRMIWCRRVSSIGLKIYHGLRAAGARASQIFTTVSARRRAPIVDSHHRFGALARANRRYSPPFRRAGAR